MIAANLLVLGVIALALTPGILKIRADRKRRKELPANVFPGCASCPLIDHCTTPAESCSAAGSGRTTPSCSCGQ